MCVYVCVRSHVRVCLCGLAAFAGLGCMGELEHRPVRAVMQPRRSAAGVRRAQGTCLSASPGTPPLRLFRRASAQALWGSPRAATKRAASAQPDGQHLKLASINGCASNASAAVQAKHQRLCEHSVKPVFLVPVAVVAVGLSL